jgi:hypothetical protein
MQGTNGPQVKSRTGSKNVSKARPGRTTLWTGLLLSFHPKINVVSVPGSVGARGIVSTATDPLERQEIPPGEGAAISTPFSCVDKTVSRSNR